MPSLREKQRGFADRLLADRVGEGFAVYRDNVFGNRADALAGAYPIVRKIVGDAFFDALARRYARERDSASGDLSDYGADFAAFLAAFPATLDVPYLPDVARMEWLVHRAWYAADPPPPDLERLQRLDGWQAAALPLRLAPASALMTSEWPLERLWTVHQDDHEGGIDVDLAAGPETIVVHRPRWRVQVRAVAAGDRRFLEAAQRGATLGAALEQAAGADDAFDAAGALARWVGAGAIAL